LEHAEEIKRNLFGTAHALQEQEINAVGLLKDALSLLQQAERHMSSLSVQAERLQSAFIEIKDLGAEISRIEQGITWDEERLATVYERLDLLYTLQQKHRVDNVAGLITLRNELAERLAALSSDDEEIARLEVEVGRLKAEMLTFADQLSASRRAVIPHVQDEVSEVLRTMGMPHSQLRISLDLLDEESVRTSGRDRIEFLFTANKGQDPQ